MPWGGGSANLGQVLTWPGVTWLLTDLRGPSLDNWALLRGVSPPTVCSDRDLAELQEIEQKHTKALEF